MIQGTVLAVGFAVLLVLIFQQFGSPEETTRKLLEHSAEKATPPKGMALRQWINFILLFGCAGVLCIHRRFSGFMRRKVRVLFVVDWQRCHSCLCARPLIAILVGVTVAAHLPESLEGAKTDTALTVMLRQVAEGGWFGTAIVVLILAAILGAIMSTGGTRRFSRFPAC